MKYEVRITATASVDIERNAEWWAENHSSNQAEKWMRTIERQIDTLSEMPFRRSLSAENSEFKFEIRDLLVGLGSPPTYRAVFTVVDNVVHVLAVRRSSQGPIHKLDFPIE